MILHNKQLPSKRWSYTSKHFFFFTKAERCVKYYKNLASSFEEIWERKNKQKKTEGPGTLAWEWVHYTAQHPAMNLWSIRFYMKKFK